MSTVVNEALLGLINFIMCAQRGTYNNTKNILHSRATKPTQPLSVYWECIFY